VGVLGGGNLNNKLGSNWEKKKYCKGYCEIRNDNGEITLKGWMRT
jgi:hypothetical protein